MDELSVVLMSPRRKGSLLSSAVSSSMLRGDSETECILKKLVDDAIDDEPFLERKLDAAFHMFVALTLNKFIRGFETVAKHTKKVYGWVKL
jgi:hypothetical protein